MTRIKQRTAELRRVDLFRSLNIEICNLFEFWCLRFGIFNTAVSFSIKLTAFQAGGWAET
jgi:hypothetical protein